MKEGTRDSRISAAILAGGRSTRFGTAKAVAMLDGRPLVQHAFDAVRPLADEVLLSLGSHEESQKLLDVTDQLLPGAIVVYDEEKGCGPLGGIYSCMRLAAHPWLLILAGDLPRIRTASLRRLLEACTDDVQIVHAAESGGQSQPLCGCYHVSLLPVIEQAIYDRRYAVFGLLDDVQQVRKIDFDADELVNVNRPEDLDAAGQGC